MSPAACAPVPEPHGSALKPTAGQRVRYIYIYTYIRACVSRLCCSFQGLEFKRYRQAVYPLVSSRDVLQCSGSCLARAGVDLTLMQRLVVYAHYLRMPQPLHTLWHSSNLSESGEILVLPL